jgi:hypothetical protein
LAVDVIEPSAQIQNCAIKVVIVGTSWLIRYLLLEFGSEQVKFYHGESSHARAMKDALHRHYAVCRVVVCPQLDELVSSCQHHVDLLYDEQNRPWLSVSVNRKAKALPEMHQTETALGKPFVWSKAESDLNALIISAGRIYPTAGHCLNLAVVDHQAL